MEAKCPIQQPEPLLREVWHYLSFLKSKANDKPAAVTDVRPGYGSVPGIELADDFFHAFREAEGASYLKYIKRP